VALIGTALIDPVEPRGQFVRLFDTWFGPLRVRTLSARKAIRRVFWHVGDQRALLPAGVMREVCFGNCH
jgi:hypothetical protein